VRNWGVFTGFDDDVGASSLEARFRASDSSVASASEGYNAPLELGVIDISSQNLNREASNSLFGLNKA
jgi:hypothetical protein